MVCKLFIEKAALSMLFLTEGLENHSVDVQEALPRKARTVLIGLRMPESACIFILPAGTKKGGRGRAVQLGNSDKTN